ncbi:hypothetical protein Pdw03_1945 [Penicillium digitatum]|uniref:Uncharacterized protein n=1 Tax=Penicillium digitatum TaxID=36651 RepID=A0A7T7BP71_PENDI|nr:hypothetical protein Pdw03_1945 [Penicillium digitatum]
MVLETEGRVIGDHKDRSILTLGLASGCHNKANNPPRSVFTLNFLWWAGPVRNAGLPHASSPWATQTTVQIPPSTITLAHGVNFVNKDHFALLRVRFVSDSVRSTRRCEVPDLAHRPLRTTGC